MRRLIVRLFTLAAVIPLAAGCALRSTERRAMFEPGADGATGSTVRGVIIDAAVGGTGGAAIGRQMDTQAEELAYALPGATVQRVGEGIAVTFPEHSLFRFQSEQLTPAARKTFRTLAASLNRYPNTRMLIVDHTDAHVNLSDRRARSAASFLSSEGVVPARICTAGRGDVEPSHADPRRNQRVEIAIYAN